MTQTKLETHKKEAQFTEKKKDLTVMQSIFSGSVTGAF